MSDADDSTSVQQGTATTTPARRGHPSASEVIVNLLGANSEVEWRQAQKAAAELTRSLMPAYAAVRETRIAPDLRLEVAETARTQARVAAWAPGAVRIAPAWIAQFQTAAAQIAQTVRPWVAEYSRAAEAMRPAIEAWSRNMRHAKRIEAAGWLPHYTTPWNQLDEALEDPALINSILEEYYADRWSEVRREFAKRLRFYDIDDEAKSLFREAMTAHRRGHFRSCIRSLFPEIERLARLELPATKGGPSVALSEAAGELGMSEIEPGGWYGLQLFSKLKTQAYASVWTDEEAAVAAAFQAPSRHATVHGRVAYSSPRNSINALIMADYAYQVISVTKANRAILRACDDGEKSA